MRASPADPKAPWRVILATDGVRDPAIAESVDAASLVEYVYSRDPEMIGEQIKLNDGVKPTWFTLAPLSFAFVSEVLAREPSPDKQRELACRAALVGAEGPMAQMIKLDEREAGVGKMQLLVPTVLEYLRDAIGYDGIRELGDVALVRARLRAGARGPFGLCR
jgi:hypothetical protein